MVQSLCKDMTSDLELYRANAIRVLARIVDASMLAQIERYIRQAIVDKSPYVSSAALVSSLQLQRKAPDVVRRWLTEVQSALQSRSPIPEFLALGVLHALRSSDALAVSRLITNLRRQDLTSNYSVCLLIRITASLLRQNLGATDVKAAYAFLESCLGKSYLLSLEAGRAMLSLPDTQAQDLQPVAAAMMNTANSQNLPARIAALRMLVDLSCKHPELLTQHSADLERLAVGRNKLSCTLAIQVLLRVVPEGRVDRLLRVVSRFLNEVKDEFRTPVVQAVHQMVLRVPSTAPHVFNLVGNALRDEGGYLYKCALVDVLVDCLVKIPGSGTSALMHLCEFIEDCEYTALATRVLHLIGTYGPADPEPASYVRFVYNRVILENAAVRAAAVSVLAKFGARVPALRESIVPLLQMCAADNDDEVRERAVLALAVLDQLELAGDQEDAAELVATMTQGALPMAPDTLMASLLVYQAHPSDGDLTLAALPAVGEVEDTTYAAAVKTAAVAAGVASSAGAAAAGAGPANSPSAVSSHAGAGAGSGAAAGAGGARELAASPTGAAAAAVLAVPELRELGPLFKSTSTTLLTEEEVEYVVSLTKHTFEEHVVFDFSVRNTLAEVQLARLAAHLKPADEETRACWDISHSVGISKVTMAEPGHVYVAVRRAVERDAGYPNGKWDVELKFHALDVDPETGEPYDDEGFEEAYPLEQVSVGLAQYVRRAGAPTNFRGTWESFGADSEAGEQYELPYASTAAAFRAFCAATGLTAVGGTDVVEPDASKHAAFLVGNFVGGMPIVARAQFMTKPGATTTLMRMAVRSEDADLSSLVCVAWL